MKNGKWKMENLLKVFLMSCVLSVGVFAQSTEPKPSAPKSVKVPAVKEFTLKNGLKVAVVERKDVPLVSVQLLVKSGAENEDEVKAGLADMTASLLTKGTKTRSATQIAEQMEFLGADLNSGAGWNSSTVSVNVMSDKLDQAMEIMADTILNPGFKQDEIDLLKSQTIDGLTYNLTQPGFLANYVASKYSFGEHPSGGTPQSITSISQKDFVEFHKEFYMPQNSILIFTGDITDKQANSLADKFFGKWGENSKTAKKIVERQSKSSSKVKNLVNKIVVLDLPNSGQASVNYVNRINNGRIKCVEDLKCGTENSYYSASVLNSLLGGGYSSRLNQEIRIKRGLSYGAGSSFAWRSSNANFGTRTQTKNESAAEVAELVVTELKRLSDGEIPEAELNPRRLVLTGGFGRNLETNQGLASAISDLYSFGLSADTLNSYMNDVMAVKDKQIKQFAAENFDGGDIIIVGDYAKFKDDLAKRFPDMKVEVIKADELDISQENLKK